MRNLRELNRLEEYLKEFDIPYKREDVFGEPGLFGMMSFDRHIIIVYRNEEDKINDKRCFDAICQYGSYGESDGLLEIYGDIVENEYDEVEGWLTADEVFSRLRCIIR